MWLKWGKGPGYTTYTWPGLDELLINKLCYSNTSIKARVLFVLSSFSPNHLFGNSDLLFPDNGPVVRSSEGTLCLPSCSSGFWAASRFERQTMLAVSWETLKANGDSPQWPDDFFFPGRRQLSISLQPSVDELLVLLRTRRARWASAEQWWNSASCRRIALKENCINMNKIWSLICLMVSFIKHTMHSSREFCLQGSVSNMTLHLSYYYYGEYLCFTASWLLDLFFPLSYTY